LKIGTYTESAFSSQLDYFRVVSYGNLLSKVEMKTVLGVSYGTMRKTCVVRWIAPEYAVAVTV
jgi:hypothetical protein